MKKITLLSAILITNLMNAQTFNETFDADTGIVTTFSKTLAGIVFNFTFTTDGDSGDFAWDSANGESSSPSINAASSSFDLATTERITITRADGNKFKFNSIFIDNAGGDVITLAGFDNNSLVGSSQNAITSFIGTLNFGDIIVDEVRLTSTDFINSNFDSFMGDVDTVLGIDDVDFANTKISVFPIPSVNYIQVSGLTTPKIFNIYNVLGAKVVQGNINNNQKINVSTLAKGLYFLKLDRSKTIKFIKN